MRENLKFLAREDKVKGGIQVGAKQVKKEQYGGRQSGAHGGDERTNEPARIRPRASSREACSLSDIAFTATLLAAGLAHAGDQSSTQTRANEFSSNSEVVEAIAIISQSESFKVSTVAGEAIVGVVSGDGFSVEFGVDPETDVSRVDDDRIFQDSFE